MTNEIKNRLIRILESLPSPQAAQLLDFAEFLNQRHAVAHEIVEPIDIPQSKKEHEIVEPVDIPRPEQESVPKAIKRLAETYPMLSRKMLLDETGTYMTQHMMERRPAKEVIDDLEVMFRGHYENLRDGNT